MSCKVLVTGQKCIKLMVLMVCVGTYISGYCDDENSKNIRTVENEEPNKILKPAGPYCGAYCLYSVLKVFGKKPDIHDLIQPKYISSARGSTLSQLEDAAKAQGLYTCLVQGFTVKDLQQLAQPMILHVKSDIEKNEYSHFITFLGVKQGHAQVIDPPVAIQSIPFSALAALWDGAGLILSDKPIISNAVFAPAHNRSVRGIIICIILLCLVTLRKMLLGRIGRIFRGHRMITLLNMKRSPGSKMVLRRALYQCACIVIISLISGMIYNGRSNDIGLGNAYLNKSIQNKKAAAFMRKISKNEMQDAVSIGNQCIIDARFEADYLIGHIGDAINIPITADQEMIRARLKHLSKYYPLIVYCQSDACSYAEIVSQKLMAESYMNISFYSGGWNDWQATRQH